MDIDPVYILYIPVFLLAITVHEMAHALVAYWGGDDTASLQGRLTLNPIPHIDPFGTIVFPLILVMTQSGILFGWARPVPVNPVRLKNSRWMIWVSLAGPASNLILLIVSIIALKLFLMGVAAFYSGGSEQFLQVVMGIAVMLRVSIILNFILMVFNLLPVPPLDGSKIAYELFFRWSDSASRVFAMLEQYGMIVLIVLLYPMGLFLGWSLGLLGAFLERALNLPI